MRAEYKKLPKSHGRLKYLKKLAILSHRWTGAAFCVLFAWWFISGLFIMYFDYPGVDAAARLARSDVLDRAHVTLTASEAWSRLHLQGEPDAVTLAMFDRRPAYLFRLGGARAVVFADNGQTRTQFPPDLNLRTAAAWTGQPAGIAKAETVTSPDQWTVGGIWNRAAPPTKYSWPDGSQVYVSPATGEVVQYTTRASPGLARGSAPFHTGSISLRCAGIPGCGAAWSSGFPESRQ